MEKSDYTVSITVQATVEQAFKSINSVSKWWTVNVEGRSEKLNDEFIVRSGDVHYSKHKIIEVIPDKKIVWLVTDSKLNWIKNNKEEWTNTKMVFQVFEQMPSKHSYLKVQDAYFSMYGKSLNADLESELSSNEYNQVISLMSGKPK